MNPKPILIVYFSGYGRYADERETMAAVDLIKQADLFEIVNEMWDTALRRLWTYDGDIMVMEHDVVPSVAMARAILNCKEIWCTQRYRLYKGTTNLPYEILGERWLGSDGELHATPYPDPSVDLKKEWSDGGSFCFTKLSPAFRRQINFDALFKDPTMDVANMDNKLCALAITAKLKCHIHFPEMKHNHRERVNEWQHVRKTVLTP